MNKEFFERGVEEIIEEKSFWQKIKSGQKLRVKMGLDPTKPDIHLGHAVGLLRLRELQDAGHKIIIIIGDYTTKIGDPSGRNTTRPMLSDNEIKANAKTYFNQVGKILDLKKLEIVYNSKWFSKMSFNDILQIVGKFTVAQILERDDFETRLKEGKDVGLHEILYPLMQAYDSIMVKSDVEFGGTDQKFNILAGRSLQKKMGETAQEAVFLKILVGTDGTEKMSKSLGNYIGITEEPKSIFGKVMSIKDELIVEYFSLTTKVTDEKIEKIKKALKAGDNPKQFKVELAEEIVKLFYGEKIAKSAREEFDNVFTKKELPSDISEVKLSGNYQIIALLTLLGAVESNSKARQLISQGGVKIDSTKIQDPNAQISTHPGMIIQVGKLKYYKIK
jgi:tyrosyl-tRNA synthetase